MCELLLSYHYFKMAVLQLNNILIVYLYYHIVCYWSMLICLALNVKTNISPEVFYSAVQLSTGKQQDLLKGNNCNCSLPSVSSVYALRKYLSDVGRCV